MSFEQNIGATEETVENAEETTGAPDQNSSSAAEEPAISADEVAATTAVVPTVSINAPVVGKMPLREKWLTLKKNKKFYNFVYTPVLLLLIAILRTVTVEVFTLPYNFAPGGATGVATMIQYKTGFSTGYTILLVNAPLLVLAFLFLGKGFAIKTAVSIGLSSLGMVLFDILVPAGFIAENLPIEQPMLAAAAAGILTGVSLAIMFRLGASTGGSDIIAMFIQKKHTATNVAWFIMSIDAVVVVISYFVYGNGLTPILLSLTQMLCQSMMTDTISSGFRTALKFEIITAQPEELSQELLRKLGRGVTMLDGTGMYSHNKRALLICVISKRQLAEFNKILKKYSDTFAYITSVGEVMGKGFGKDS